MLTSLFTMERHKITDYWLMGIAKLIVRNSILEQKYKIKFQYWNKSASKFYPKSKIILDKSYSFLQ